MLLNFFGILINRAMDQLWREQKLPIRILLTVWMFASLILTNIYSSDLYSILTVPISSRPIDTIDDIIDSAQSDHHYILMVNYTNTWSHIINSKPNDGMYHIIGQHLNR